MSKTIKIRDRQWYRASDKAFICTPKHTLDRLQTAEAEKEIREHRLIDTAEVALSGVKRDNRP